MCVYVGRRVGGGGGGDPLKPPAPPVAHLDEFTETCGAPVTLAKCTQLSVDTDLYGLTG